MSNSKILFQVTGSIAAFKSVQAISQLVKNGHDVQVVATPAALEFIGPATFEGLTGKPILTHSFESGKMMAHIDWARWADILVLCPATAKSINALAGGTHEGLVGDLFLANNFLRPYVVVPAMNSQMYQHPATQKSISLLQDWGCLVMKTATGSLACGEYGDGRMVEAIEVVNQIENILNPVNKPKILITAGGTSESIDGVRNITNFSTGETGRILAEHLRNSFNIYYVKSESAATPAGIQNIFTFKSSDQLERTVKQLISHYHFDSVVQAAAISDFQVESVNGNKPDEEIKVDSSEGINLKLARRSKIIDQLKGVSRNHNIKIVGFKLTNTKDKNMEREQILKLSMNPNIDFVVHNEIGTSRGLSHKAEIYKKDKVISKTESKDQLAKYLENLIKDLV